MRFIFFLSGGAVGGVVGTVGGAAVGAVGTVATTIGGAAVSAGGKVVSTVTAPVVSGIVTFLWHSFSTPKLKFF